MVEIEYILILMVAVWVAGKVFRFLNLPVIFGELLGGILVGPLIFGLVAPDSPTIQVLAELGIFFLMLHAGLEADPFELLESSKKSVFIALGSILIPFIATYIVAQMFGQNLITSLYISMCASITAVAISARLFKDLKMQNTRAAHVTMGAAIMNDIAALILFSVLINLHETGTVNPGEILLLVAKITLFFGVVLFLGFRLSKYMGRFLQEKGFTFSLIVALSMGLLAEWMGLHMILGAFLAGLFIREEIIDPKVFQKIEDRIYGLSYSFLGPIFIASLAFHLDFSAMATMPVFIAAIIGVAIVGKVVGAFLPAIWQKIPLKEALVIGLAMNSRGAVELVLASLGYEKGVIDQTVFSLLVIMGFVTTLFSILAVRFIMAKTAKA